MKARSFLFALIMGVALFGGLTVNTAQACPMCKNAIEEDDSKPKAYMYSILFMMAVPASIFTCFGVSFYRLSKQMPQDPEVLDALQDQSDQDMI